MNRYPKPMQAKSRKCIVTPVDDGFMVLSPSGESYHVNERCSCDWAYYHPHRICAHRMAALNYVTERKGKGRLSFWQTEGDAKRQHRRWAWVSDVVATIRIIGG